MWWWTSTRFFILFSMSNEHERSRHTSDIVFILFFFIFRFPPSLYATHSVILPGQLLLFFLALVEIGAPYLYLFPIWCELKDTQVKCINQSFEDSLSTRVRSFVIFHLCDELFSPLLTCAHCPRSTHAHTTFLSSRTDPLSSCLKAMPTKAMISQRNMRDS